MAEVLADIVLATTIAMAYADNIGQQTTINIEARGKVVSGGGNDIGVIVAVVTAAMLAVGGSDTAMAATAKVMVGVAAAGAMTAMKTILIQQRWIR